MVASRIRPCYGSSQDSLKSVNMQETMSHKIFQIFQTKNERISNRIIETQ